MIFRNSSIIKDILLHIQYIFTKAGSLPCRPHGTNISLLWMLSRQYVNYYLPKYQASLHSCILDFVSQMIYVCLWISGKVNTSIKKSAFMAWNKITKRHRTYYQDSAICPLFVHFPCNHSRFIQLHTRYIEDYMNLWHSILSFLAKFTAMEPPYLQSLGPKPASLHSSLQVVNRSICVKQSWINKSAQAIKKCPCYTQIFEEKIKMRQTLSSVTPNFSS